MCALIAVPYIAAGTNESAGLFAYAGAWRSGDGAFSLILALAEALIGGDWTRIAGFTLTRHQLARAITAAIFAAALIVLLRKRRAVPEQSALVVLLLLLLSPTLHPWYALWLLPLLPFAGRGALSMILLLALAPLLHHGSWLELEEGAWRELASVRLLVHTPVWAALVWDLLRTPALGYAANACPSKTAS
jgi:hypothetical protein